MLGTAMYEVSSVGGNRLEAAAAIRAQGGTNAPHHRSQNTVKEHMMKFLRRSKSMAQRAVSTHEESHQHVTKPVVTVKRHSHQDHHHKKHHEHIERKKEDNHHVNQKENSNNHNQPHIQPVQTRNGMVVAIVDGLPFVVGAKNKNKVDTNYKFLFTH